MGKYNFENDGNEFDKTIRIGDLNKEIIKHESEEKNDFEEDDDIKIYKKSTDKKENDLKEERKVSSSNRYKKERPHFSTGAKAWTVAAASILFVIIICISAIAVKNIFYIKEDKQNVIKNAENIFENNNSNEIYVVKAFKNNIVYLLGVENGKIYSAEVNDDTVITGVNGGKISFSLLSAGDIVTLTQNADKTAASRIMWAEDAWKKTDMTDVRVDVNSSSVSCGDEIYKFNSNTMFLSDGEEISPNDVSWADVVNLTGIKNNVLSISVTKPHGYIHFKNTDKINSPKVRIDFGDEYDVTKDELDVPQGKHTIVVTGTNIDDYMTEADIASGQVTDIDLGLSNEKTTKLNISVKPDGNYSIKINNEEYPSGTKSVDLSTGKYLIEISRKGFEDFSKEIEIEENKPEMDFEAVLTPKKETVPPQSGTHTPQISAPSTNEKTGTLTVYSSPGWAKVYIDGEYKGITPVMANLTYGDHYVKLTLEGYDSIGNHIDVNSPDQSYTGKFE